MSIYDFEVKDGDGNTVSLSQYKDKVLLIVNSATFHYPNTKTKYS